MLDSYSISLVNLDMKKNTIIFDLDGTLANIDVRRTKSLKPNGKLNWDIFASSTSIMDKFLFY